MNLKIALGLCAPLVLVAAAPGPAFAPPRAPTKATTPPPEPARAKPSTPTPLPTLVKLEFPKLGIRFGVFDPGASPQPQQPLDFYFLMVTVDILPDKTLAEDMKLIKDWASNRGLKFLNERNPSAQEWVAEWAGGSLFGSKMHGYSRLCFANGKVYDLKASLDETGWAKIGPKLKACVDSFELLPATDPAPAPAATPDSATKTEFPRSGFRITPPDLDTDSDKEQFVIYTHYRTDDGGFVGVAVTVRKYDKTLAEFVASYRPEEAKNPTEKFPNPNTWTFESNNTHNRFVLTKGKLFQVSAMPSYGKNQSPELKALIRQCIDSLEPMESAAPMPAPEAPSR